MATLAIAGLGAVIGSSFGYAALGWTIGATVGQLLFPGKLPDVKGPRLTDLRVQVSTYGVMIPIIFGTDRVAGNVIWSTPLKEKKKKKKSGGKGGPSQTAITYTYSASFAVSICKGPIAGVRRIWANGTLIFDLGNAATAESIAASNQSAKGIKIYLGTESQLPDPTIEAYKGVGNVPAYRGQAYAVFTDFQLEKYGNSVSNLNLTFEVVSNGGSVGYRRLTYQALGLGITDVVNLGWKDGVLRFADNFNRSLQHSVSIDGPYLGSSAVTGFVPSRTGRHIGPTYYEYLTVARTPLGDLVLDEKAFEYAFGSGDYTGLLAGSTPLDTLFPAGSYFKGLAFAPGEEANLIFVLLTTTYGTAGTGWCLLRYGASGSSIGYFVERSGTIFGVLDSIGYCSIASVAVGSTLNDYRTAVLESERYVWFAYGAGNGDVECWEIGDDDVLRRVGSLTGGSGLPSYNFAVPALAASGGVCIAYCDSYSSVFTRVSGLSITNPTVGSIVGALCEYAGVTAGERDTSSLTETVTGYTLSQQMTARAAIEPLMQAFGIDAVVSGNVAKFVPRGGAVVATVSDDHLAAYAEGSERPPVLVMSRAQETDLPRSVRVAYKNPAADYQTATQEAQRRQTSSMQALTVELAVAMSDAQARAAATRILYNLWQARTTYQASVPRDYIALEPTDPVTLAGRRMRVTSAAFGANGVIQLEAEAEDSASVYTQAPAASPSVAPVQSLGLPGPTLLEVMDLPALLDLHNDGGVYVAVRGQLSGWKGAVLYKSNDAGESWAEIDALLDEAPIGVATTLLPTGPTTVWDYVNSVTVTVLGGQPESETALNVLNGANAGALGGPGRWEIIQWQTATLTAANTYTLSGLLRGRRGTEWATALHAVGDTFVILDPGLLSRVILNTNDYGVARLWRAASVDLDTLSGDAVEVTAVPESLVPYAPTHARLERVDASEFALATHWRLRVTAYGSGNVGLAELELRDAIGGTNLLTGGTASASSYYDLTQAPDKAFDGDNATAWVAGGGPVQTLQYVTPAPIAPRQMALRARSTFVENTPTAWELQYSTDAGSTWITVDTRSSQTGWTAGELRTYAIPTIVGAGLHRYWRLYFTAGVTGYVTVSEVELRSSLSGADATGSGTASADSTYSGSYPASNAFDNSLSSQWTSATGYPHWLKYDFGASSPVAITEYTIRAKTEHVDDRPTEWSLQYSDDNAQWTTVDTRTAQVFVPGETKTFSFGKAKLSWIRRARVNAEWLNGADVPLDESSERYRVRFLDLTTGAPLAGYSWIVEDATEFVIPTQYIVGAYGAPDSSLRVDVAQISSLVGVGRAIEVTL